MNPILYTMLGIAGTLYVKDDKFRAETNKICKELFNNLTKDLQKEVDK